MNSIDQFYQLSEKLSSATIQAHPLDSNFGKEKKYREYIGQLFRGNYLSINFPVIFKQEYGKRFDDVLRTGAAILYLISDKMVEVLSQNNLTGWKTFEIKLLDKKGIEIKGYNGLSIVGRCGPIDYNKSTIIKKKLVEEGPLSEYYKGLPIGLEKWDGTDLFLPEPSAFIITTSRARQILETAKLTNLEFENLADIEMPKI